MPGSEVSCARSERNGGWCPNQRHWVRRDPNRDAISTKRTSPHPPALLMRRVAGRRCFVIEAHVSRHSCTSHGKRRELSNSDINDASGEKRQLLGANDDIATLSRESAARRSDNDTDTTLWATSVAMASNSVQTGSTRTTTAKMACSLTNRSISAPYEGE